MRLINCTTGELVLGRCKSTNRCGYCRLQAVIETVEMLQLDAAEYAPTLMLTLTAREHLQRSDCREHLSKLRRSLKRTWADIEWFVQVEFQKRAALHLHLLIKGVLSEDERPLYEAATRLWCARVDAKAGPFDYQDRGGQRITRLYDAAGIAGYLGKELSHGLKSEQAPPLGWNGHRTSHTAGYFVRPTPVMREEARASIASKRALHRAIEAGHQGVDAELEAAADVARAAQTRWGVVGLDPYGGEPLVIFDPTAVRKPVHQIPQKLPVLR